jgi:two-component system, OmpR family, catabolic regulation response regulator CreB
MGVLLDAPRILLLEDEVAIADTLVYALGTDGFVVEHVTLAQAALDAFDRQPHDLVILDIGVPDGSGLDVCRALRGKSAAPIVFLTARDDEIDRIVGFELGADDYVSKPFSPREVCVRIRAILRRTQARGGASDRLSRQTSSLHSSGLSWDQESQSIRYQGQVVPLTRYEYLLLATLLKRPGRIFSRAELMGMVWHQAQDTSERTVDAHVKLLRAKLRVLGVASDCIQTHRHMGYSLKP